MNKIEQGDEQAVENENTVEQDSLENPELPGDEESAGDKSTKSKKGLAALLALLAILFSKLKFLLVFLKAGKFMSTAISMLVTIGIYASMFGWKYALGFVLLIFIHEMGHFLAAKRVGLPVSAPIFIPFVGAFISMKDQPHNAVIEARVALGGPVLGSLAALFCLVIGLNFQDGLSMSLAYSGFLINLFNLIPVSPLDGGRIVTAISPKIWLIGLPILAVSCFYFFNPLVILLLIMGAYQAYQHWKSNDTSYYDTPNNIRLRFAFLYFGLLLLLGVGMAYIHNIYPV